MAINSGNKNPLTVLDVARMRKEELMSITDEQIKAHTKKEILLDIAEFYRDLALFPDEDILLQMKKFGLEEEDLRWFISYKNIDRELALINSQNIEVEPLESFFCIKAHLHYKILHTLTNWAGLVTEGSEKSLVYMNYHNLDRRKRYIKRREKDPNNLYEYLISQEYDQIKSKDGEKGIERHKDYLQGKTEKYFLKQLIVNTLSPTPEMSERKFHCAIFNLMRLLVQGDHEMDTEEEFQVKRGYDSDYDVYRDKRIRDIFF